MNAEPWVRNVALTDVMQLTSEQRYTYGGLEFVRLGASSPLPDQASLERARPFASVACTVSGAGVPVTSHAHRRSQKRVHARWSGARGAVDGHGVRVHLRALAPRRFVASVQCDLSNVTAHPVEDVLNQAILERCGGAVLHAAAIEIDGRALAFVGPSGAGKTTACGLTGRPWFSRDRLAVAPTDDGWWAWPLAGGSVPPSSRASGLAALPLAGVLRVVQSDRTRLQVTQGVQSVLDVRSCCFVGDTDAKAEPNRLEVVENLCNQVPVGRLHTVLGEDPTEGIRSWLTN